jgi:hypothetical protein
MIGISTPIIPGEDKNSVVTVTARNNCIDSLPS